MKVAFVYPDLLLHRFDWPGYFYSGLGTLSASLKLAGHQTCLIQVTQPINQVEFVRRIEEAGPDLIGFSSTSHMFPFVRQWVGWLRESGIKTPTICGGIHCSIAPEEAIATEGLDMICRGEGEAALVELCHKLENREDITGIANLWIKSQGEVIKNPLRPLVEDVDTLPFADRSIFAYQDLYQEREGRASFLAGRGCPYSCTYCCNHLLRKIYGSEGKPIRFRSVDSLMREIKEVLQHYPFINSLIFDDDILFLNRKWAREFAEKYGSEVHLPFTCNARADRMDEELVGLFKKAGCKHLKFGLESGNEYIREQILHRHMSNDQIKAAFALCKKTGLVTESFNMVGIPFDTANTILDTIKLNAAIEVDRLQVTIYQPYQGTKLAELCQKHHFLKSRDKDLSPDWFSPSTIELDTVTPQAVLMFRDYFKVLVRIYQFLPKLPFGIGSFFTRILDRILCLAPTARILNLAYLPANHIYRKLLFLRINIRARRLRKGLLEAEKQPFLEKVRD